MTSYFRSKEEWEQEYLHGAHWEKQACSFVVEFAATLPSGAHVFDAGCGSGRNSLYLSEMGFLVTGMDISEVAIKRAQQTAIEQNKNIDFVNGNLEHLGAFQTHCFDAVYCEYVIPNLDTNQLLPQLHRVLKPEGKALIVALYETLYDPPCKFDHVVDLNVLKKQLQMFFKTEHSALDVLEDTDQHGFHRHKRAFFQLVKKAI